MFFLEQQLPAIIQQFYQQLKENIFWQLFASSSSWSKCPLHYSQAHQLRSVWQLLFTKKELRVGWWLLRRRRIASSLLCAGCRAESASKLTQIWCFISHFLCCSATFDFNLHRCVLQTFWDFDFFEWHFLVLQ